MSERDRKQKRWKMTQSAREYDKKEMRKVAAMLMRDEHIVARRVMNPSKSDNF